MLSDRVEAAGKPYRKPKFHVCVCVSEKIYFFINHSAKFEGSFEIAHEELPSLPNSKSYIGCGLPLRIPDKEFNRKRHKVVGRLPEPVLLRLLDHVNETESLTETDRVLIVDALADAIRD